MIKFQPIDDKALHVYAGIAISILSGFAIYYFSTCMPIVACFSGLGIGTLVGVAKEYLWDKAMKKGTFSTHDMLATFWGSCVGAVALRVIIDLLEK